MKLFKNLRDRVMPMKDFAVELRIHSSHNDRYIGRMQVTTTARSKSEAERNVKNYITLHIGKVSVVKKPKGS